MQRCDFRTNRECACCDSEACQQQDAIIIGRDGPYIRMTAKQQQFVFWMVIIFLASLIYPALSSANHGFKKQDLDRQEQISWKR